MGLLHRHLFFSVLGACAAAVGLFAFVLIAGLALRDLLAYVMAGQIELGTAVRLVGLMLPYVALHALPIGLLTAVLLVLGRMSSQQEITAMRAAGLSLGYVARPVWLIAVAAVGLSLALNFYIMPKARTEHQATLVGAVKQNPLNFIVPRTFIRDFPKYVVYVGERDGPELKDFWVWTLDEQKRVIGIARAASARLDYREEENILRLTLRQASVETRNEEDPEDFSKPSPVPNSDVLEVDLPLGGIFRPLQAKSKPAWMTYGQLAERRAALEGKGAGATKAEEKELLRVKMTQHQKAAASFAVLAFALVAVPLGIKVSRKETSANLGIAVGLLLGYYFLTTLISLLERVPALHPEWWMWLPPLGYALAGGWLFRRVDRI